MSNVATFASPYPSYPEPDFSLIAQSTKDISRLAVFRTDKMAIMDKAKRASSYALDLQTAMGEDLVSLSTKVQNLDFRELFGQLAEIDAELAKGKLSAEETEAAEGAREELAGVFATGIRETKGKLRDAAAKVKQKAAETRGVVLAERTQETLTEHQQRQPGLIKSLAEKKAAWEKLDTDRAKIIAAQDVIRARNVADIFKDFIPKDLEKLDLKKPEAEAVRLGVEVLKKILGEVSEGFKYSDLADQRRVFDGKIEQLDRDIQTLLGDQRENDALIADLSAVMTIDARRDVLLNETNKLTVAFSGFADELEKLSGSAVTEASVTKLLGTIRSYLGNCVDARNQVIIT
ncbi:MAG: alpha-xenorhabdolysin family binary toxin subunit B [Bryobacteraceae bacterium]|nr:alpha-xenorhabdolysin family binary toxin subunit B [Bryobacteraceae bacterium]